MFAALERNALRSLPAEPFDMSQWSRARVNIDYHIAFDANFYSVPYTLVHELVEVRATPTAVEIFRKGQRPRIFVAVAEARYSPSANLGRRVTKHTWSGLPRAW